MQLRGKASRWGAAALTIAALAAGGVGLSGATTARAQAPQSVPAARFYGTVRNTAGAPAVSGIVSNSVPVSGGVTAYVGSVQCGIGPIDNAGMYFVDIQSAPGCTTPGATVTFTVQGIKARESSTVPAIQGSAVRQDLTLSLIHI